VLDRTAGVVDADRKPAGVAADQIGDVLTTLWGEARPATWNRNRAAVGSWLAEGLRGQSDPSRAHP